MARAQNRLLIKRFLGIALAVGALVPVSLCAPPPEEVSVDKPGSQEKALNERAVVDKVPGDSGEATTPYPLTPRQCQCDAASNATIANLLDREREDQERKQGGHFKLKTHGSARAASMKEEILTDTAWEVRNRAASSALEAYFRLAETDARSELAEKAAVVVGEAVARGQKLKAQGVKTPPELDTLERKEKDLQFDTLQLRLAQTRLQHDLKALLGSPANSTANLIRPVLDMNAYVPPEDSKAEIAKGLESRPELRMWRTLGESLGAASLPVAQSALQTVNPLASGALDEGARARSAGLRAVLERCKGGGDAEAVRQQILGYGLEREQQIASDIHRDVRLLAIQTEVLKLNRRRAADAQKRVEETAEKEAKGLAAFSDTAQARLEYLRLRNDVAEAAATLLIDQVKLREDQGLLAFECYAGPEAACPTAAGSTPGTTPP